MPRAVSASPTPHGAGTPSAAGLAGVTNVTPAMPVVDGRLSDAIAILKNDLVTHERHVAEIKLLIGKLQTYVGGTEPSAPPADRRKHRPSMGADERRARQRQKMADFRARKRAAAEPPPKAKPAKKRHRKSVAAAVEAAAAVVPPTPKKRNRKAAPEPTEADLQEINQVKAAIADRR